MVMTGVLKKRRRKDDVDETAGLGDDTFHELERALAERTVERFREDAASLLEQMDPDNAPRVYSLLEDLSTAARDWTAKLTGHGMKPNRGGLTALSESSPFVDTETWGAKAIDQLTSIFGSMGKDQQLAQLVRALKTANDGGMEELAERIRKKIDAVLGDAPPALPEAGASQESGEPTVVEEMPAGEEVVIQ